VLHLAGAFFVTRAKSNMDAHRVYSAPTDRTTGIICDQTIALDGHYTSQHYPEHLRRIRFRDATLFEKMLIHQALAQDDPKCDTLQITKQLNLFAY
jgi:hypothetical protein